MRATAKQLKKQAKMSGQEVKLTNEGFQKYGKTHFLSKKTCWFSMLIFGQTVNFMLVDRQMIHVTFNGQIPFCFTPCTDQPGLAGYPNKWLPASIDRRKAPERRISARIGLPGWRIGRQPIGTSVSKIGDFFLLHWSKWRHGLGMFFNRHIWGGSNRER